MNENPVILDLPISGFPMFQVTVEDALGGFWQHSFLAGNIPSELYSHWRETPAPAMYDLDEDSAISVLDVILKEISPAQNQYIYPCD